MVEDGSHYSLGIKVLFLTASQPATAISMRDLCSYVGSWFGFWVEIFCAYL